MAQDLRDTAFFRRYRRIAGWACYVLFGLSALFGVVSLAGLSSAVIVGHAVLLIRR